MVKKSPQFALILLGFPEVPRPSCFQAKVGGWSTEYCTSCLNHWLAIILVPKMFLPKCGTTVDGILYQSRLVVCPSIHRVFYIPGGAGFLPSTVSLQYFRDDLQQTVWCSRPLPIGHLLGPFGMEVHVKKPIYSGASNKKLSSGKTQRQHSTKYWLVFFGWVS